MNKCAKVSTDAFFRTTFSSLSWPCMSLLKLQDWYLSLKSRHLQLKHSCKMCSSKETFGCLVLLSCLFLTECRVLTFVVAVSLPPFVSARLIHRAVIWATSHQMTVALLCIVADYTRFSCSMSIVTFTHLLHKGLLWASNTASHISDRHFVHKPLCISPRYSSSTM